MSTQTFFDTLVAVECYKCHVAFGLTEQHHQRCRDHGDEFYCPNGHGQGYTKTTVKRLEEEKAALEQNLRWAREGRDAEQRRRFRTEKQLYAQRGATTRLRNRIKAGVCPCCHRSFGNLRQHMSHRHPDFGGEA